jgi:tetratricopeptide (TPR) repeat protein
MSNSPFRKDKDEIKELLQEFDKLKAGHAHGFIDEEGFQNLTNHFCDQEDFRQALEAAEYATDQFPYSASLMLDKADVLLSLKRYQEALYVLEQAELLDSTDSNLFILKTDAYLALDRQNEAAMVLEAAIQQFEGEERIALLFELADVYDDYEDFEKVFDCLRLILEQDPLNEEALYKICFWTDFTGRNEESIRLHKDIIEEHPFSELAWFNLGAAYQGIKLYEKAIDAYQYSVAIDEKFDYAYRNMGDAFIRLRKYKDAIEVLNRVLELTHPEAIIHEAIGFCQDKLENYAQARFQYKKASHLNPEDSQLSFKIAQTYMNEEAWVQAIKYLEAALKIHSRQPEYHLAMGKCLMELNRPEEAIGYLGQVVRLRPKNSKGWAELLKCIYGAGMFEEGLEYSHMAYEQTGCKPLFHYFIAAFLFAMGKSKEALLALETGLFKSPRLLNQFLKIDPSIMQHTQVVELIARSKKSRR